MRNAALALMAVSVLLLTPFVVNNFFNARPVMGALSLSVVVLLMLATWDVWKAGKRYGTIVLLGLMPMLVVFLVVSMRRQGVIGLLWCYPSVLSFYVLLPERRAWIANGVLVLALVPAAWLMFDHGVAFRAGVTLVLVSLFAVIFVRAINRKQGELERAATRDALTGLRNRVLLRGYLEQVVSRRHDRTTYALAMVDIDHFKRINDVHGHAVGDEVLREVGAALLAHFRQEDQLYRTGGEEFLVVMEGVSLPQARDAMERLRRRVAAVPRLGELGVSFSAGIAMLEPDDDVASWMKRSDDHLYEAKQAGRDRIAG